MTPKQSKMKILTRKFATVLLASHQCARQQEACRRPRLRLGDGLNMIIMRIAG
jgi:hypothetical protein